MSKIKVRDIMTKNPLIIKPETTLFEAANEMKEIDCGVLLVGNANTLLGIITDRDIVIRAIAKGANIKTAIVGDYISDKVHACNANDGLRDAAYIMGKHKISRLVVENDDGKSIGILSLGCMLRSHAVAQEIVAVVEGARGAKVIA